MIGWGDLMCAQLSKIAQLLYICIKNNQQLVFWNELKNFRRGFRFLEAFDIDGIVYLARACSFKSNIIEQYCKITSTNNWLGEMNRIYKSKILYYSDRFIFKWIKMNYRDFKNVSIGKNNIHTERSLLDLSTGNYDINYGFGTYREWKKYEDTIKKRIHFKDNIQKNGNRIIAEISSHKKKVAIHVRRTDYLILSSLILNDVYYKKAMSYFDPLENQFLVFSDDIEECKKMKVFHDKDVIFMPTNSGPVDLYLMTLCNGGNIIANSSFSFWGGLLNNNMGKKVVCPHDFIGETSKENLYINGNYYPDDWIAI